MATKKSSPKKPAAKKAATKKPLKKKSAPMTTRKSQVVGPTGHPVQARAKMLNPGECPTCTMEVNVDLTAFSQEPPTWPNAKVTWDSVNKVLTVTDKG